MATAEAGAPRRTLSADLPAVPARAWTVLAVCSATVVLTLLDSGMLFVAFPFLEERFADAASRTTLSWAVTIFFVVMVSTLLVAGRIADRFGRRMVFLSGLVTFGVAALVAASTTSVWVLVVARAVQGLGVALLAPSALALALPEFPNERRAYALGVWGTIGGVAGLLATPLGAGVVELFGWRGVFVFNGVLALLMAIVGFFVLDERESGASAGPIDVVGAAVAMIAVGALAVVLVQGSDWGWGSGATLGAIALCCVASVLFVRWNAQMSEPLVDASIFRNRRFAAASVASVMCQVGFFSAYFGIPLYMAEVWEWSAVQVGLGLLPLNAVSVLAAVPLGRMVDRYGPRGMILFGGVFAAACYLAMGLWLTEAGYVWLAFGMAFAGLGAVAIGNHTTVAALRDVDDAHLGSANAGYFMTRRLGSALGAVAVPAIVGNQTGAAFADAYLGVWIFGAVVYLIGGLVVWFCYPPWTQAMATSPVPA